MYSFYYQQVKAFKSIAFKLQACQFYNTSLRLCAFREPVLMGTGVSVTPAKAGVHCFRSGFPLLRE